MPKRSIKADSLNLFPDKKRAVYARAPDATRDVSLLSDWDDGAFPLEPPPRCLSPVKAPMYRPLKVYAIDSTRGRALGNIITLSVKYEKLLPGPIGERIRVIDYDGSRDCFYDPVDLDDPLIGMQGGVDPSDSDPHFHQQMVYAVASQTLRSFETALGRTVRSRSIDKATPLVIHIYPHGIMVPNAWVSPSPDGFRLIFGYFGAGKEATGKIVAGQTVFTCLMHDVIVGQTTRAICLGLRPDQDRYVSYGDCAAFMEGFSDICGLLLHFSHRDTLLDTIRRTGGVIYKSALRSGGETSSSDAQIQEELVENNPFVTVAPGFGEALGWSTGLRSALSKADPTAITKVTEPHERGQILLAAIFDAFFSIYVRRSQNLFKIYRAGGGKVDSIDLPDALAERLAELASQIATRVFNMCVRGLDYCPGVGLEFGDFLRACVTADYEFDPEDSWGVRDIMIQKFRGRGITSRTSFSSEDALRWPLVDINSLSTPGAEFTGLPEPDAQSQERNLSSLRLFVQTNAKALGLRPGVGFTVFPLEVSNWGATAEPPRTIVSTQLLQCRQRQRQKHKTKVRTEDSGLPDEIGITLVFDGTGRLRHVIRSD